VFGIKPAVKRAANPNINTLLHPAKSFHPSKSHLLQPSAPATQPHHSPPKSNVSSPGAASGAGGSVVVGAAGGATIDGDLTEALGANEKRGAGEEGDGGGGGDGGGDRGQMGGGDRDGANLDGEVMREVGVAGVVEDASLSQEESEQLVCGGEGGGGQGKVDESGYENDSFEFASLLVEVCVCVCMFVRMYVSVYVCVCTCCNMCRGIYVCIYVCMCVCV